MALRVIVEPLENFSQYQIQNPSFLTFEGIAKEKELMDTILLVFFQFFKKLPIFKNVLPSLRFFIYLFIFTIFIPEIIIIITKGITKLDCF